MSCHECIDVVEKLNKEFEELQDKYDLLVLSIKPLKEKNKLLIDRDEHCLCNNRHYGNLDQHKKLEELGYEQCEQCDKWSPSEDFEERCNGHFDFCTTDCFNSYFDEIDKIRNKKKENK